MSKIKSLRAREILNSRGEPTVETEVEIELGTFKDSVPSGVSNGKYEAVELRDGEDRFFGKGVLRAVKNIEEIINPRFKGIEVSNQKKIDEVLIELDGTQNKSKLGVNAILAVSLACCRAGAAAKKLPLYSYIFQLFSHFFQTNGIPDTVSCLTASGTPSLPLGFLKPCFNILEGGVHAGNKLDIQEFMVVAEMESFQENLLAGVEIYHHLKKVLEENFGKEATNVGDEGGFVPPFQNTKEALDLVTQAIRDAGYARNAGIGLDCAASEFYRDGMYEVEGEKKSREKLLAFYQGLVEEYPILFIEDPFAEDDWKGWQEISSKFKVYPVKSLQSKFNRAKSSKLFIVGDDLLATNPKRIREAKEKEACNAMILKPNQIGTITETLQAAKLARDFNWKIIVSHRGGDTCDDFIADLAVGIGADFIKTGAPCRGERVAKYNRLLGIEEELKE